MTSAETREAPPAPGRWFGPLRPLPRWPLRISAAILVLAVYNALETDLWPYIYASESSDALLLVMSLFGVCVWAVIRALKSLLSGERRVLRLGLAIADVALAVEIFRLGPILTVGVFAAHVALFHPCAKFGPTTRLGVCVNRDGVQQGKFVMYDRDDEFLKPVQSRSAAWKSDFAVLIEFHGLSACAWSVQLAPHIFLVYCG